MAAALGKAARKLTKTKIRAICLAGKALMEEDVFDSVCREARRTFSFYFESSLAGEVDTLVSSVRFRGFVKRCSETFFDFFGEKWKGRSCDKYAVLQVRWYEFVRQVLGSQEVSGIVKDISSQGKNVVSCFLESVFIACVKFVRERQEDRPGRINVTMERMNIVEDDVSMLKLGSAAVLNLKKRLRKIARPLSRSKQSLKNIVCKEIEVLEKLEDAEKRDIPCFLRNLDEGNLLVLKVEVIPFLRAFAKVFGAVVNQHGYHLLGRKLFKVAEQRVMCNTGLKKKFFEAITCLGIKISPSIRCDLFNRLLRKIYNIRCNEFVRSQKCLEEHNDKQTQDRQVMLRHKLKVAK